MNGEGMERVTVSFREEDEELLEKIDYLVEEGFYDSRSDLIRTALSPEPYFDSQTVLYDAAVATLYSAEKNGKEKIAENAEQHILQNFSGSRMAELLEQ